MNSTIDFWNSSRYGSMSTSIEVTNLGLKRSPRHRTRMLRYLILLCYSIQLFFERGAQSILGSCFGIFFCFLAPNKNSTSDFCNSSHSGSMRTSIEVTDTGLKRSPVHQPDAQAFDLLMFFCMSFFHWGAKIRFLMLRFLIFSFLAPVRIHQLMVMISSPYWSIIPFFDLTNPGLKIRGMVLETA